MHVDDADERHGLAGVADPTIVRESLPMGSPWWPSPSP
jgi:hypothetical protein